MNVNNIRPKKHLSKTVSPAGRKKQKSVQQLPEEDVAEKKGEKVMLSQDVKSSDRIAYYTELVRKMPDVRPEEVERVKKRLVEAAYNTREVFEKTAEKIIEELEQ